MNSKTPDKCQGCSACIYPWRYTVDCFNKRLPMNEWIPTCRKNRSRTSLLRGVYGECHPDFCEGPKGRSYMEIVENNKLIVKFIE